jgi:hypothetical protein
MSKLAINAMKNPSKFLTISIKVQTELLKTALLAFIYHDFSPAPFSGRHHASG